MSQRLEPIDRARSVGGSDVAAIMGISPFRTPKLQEPQPATSPIPLAEMVQRLACVRYELDTLRELLPLTLHEPWWRNICSHTDTAAMLVGVVLAHVDAERKAREQADRETQF